MSLQTFAAIEVRARSTAPFVGTMAHLKLATVHGTFDCFLSGAEAEAALALAEASRPLPVTLVDDHIVAGGELLTVTKAIPALSAPEAVLQAAGG